MTRYRLRLMGAPVLWQEDVDGSFSPVGLSRTSLAMLSLVALERSALSRGVIAETLWPDTEPEKSSSRLSSALCRLQSAVGEGKPPLLQARNGTIGMRGDIDVAVDIRELSACRAALEGRAFTEWERAEVAALESAINRREGEFLDGLEGDWVDDARRRCADIYEAGLEALIRFHRHRGRLDQSIEAARRLVRLDPYREDVQAVLVELYGAAGNRRRAIAQYAGCRDLLAAELGVAPGAALTASLGRALAAGPAHEDGDLVVLLRRLDRGVEALARQVAEMQAALLRQSQGGPTPGEGPKDADQLGRDNLGQMAGHPLA